MLNSSLGPIASHIFRLGRRRLIRGRFPRMDRGRCPPVRAGMKGTQLGDHLGV